MKWTNGNYVILGKKVMLFELWKFKAGSSERGNCLDLIAESLTLIKEPLFNVSQKSIRDRLRLLQYVEEILPLIIIGKEYGF